MSSKCTRTQAGLFKMWTKNKSIRKPNKNRGRPGQGNPEEMLRFRNASVSIVMLTLFGKAYPLFVRYVRTAG